MTQSIVQSNSKSGIAHLSAGVIGGAIFGIPVVLAVAVNYLNVSVTGNGILTNLLNGKKQQKARSKNKKHFRLTNKAIKAKSASKNESKRVEIELLKLVRSLETPRQARLRHTATVYSSLTTAFTLITPMSIGLIAVTVVSGGLTILTHWGIRSVLVQIGTLGSLGVASMAAESLTRNQSNRQWKIYATDIEHTLRVKAYNHVQRLDMAELEKHSSGQLINLIHNNPVKIRLFLEIVPQRLIDKILNLIFGVIFLLLFIPISLLFAFIALLFPYFLLRHFQQKITSEYRIVSERENNVSKQLINNLGGLPTIKSFATEAYETQRLTELSDMMRQQYVNAYQFVSFNVELSQFSLFPGLILPVVVSGIFVIIGKLSVSVFLLQNAMLPKLMQVMMHLGSDYNFYRNADTASQELNELFTKQAVINSGSVHLSMDSHHDEIKFNNVSFSYTDDERILNNINLHIEPGKTIAFVGPTGAGKTTLTKLLLRFYDTLEGQVFLNNNDLRDLDINCLRHAIGFVSQEVYLFPGSIYDNICYGSPNSTHEEIMKAAHAAEVFTFANTLPNGFNTIVGERGQMLSGGQRQRIAIARALLKNPPIIIMDEATSAIDNETEAAIQRSIARFSQGRITIIIAHRLSTVRHADCIYVLKQGEIIESGTHDTLLKDNGYYARLWLLQTGENLQEKKLGFTS
jgi:ATP-binding cassette subfamily B protein